MVRPGPCLLALVLVACISLQASAVRLPRLGLADQKCFVKSNYQSHTEGGSVVVTDDGQFEFVPHSQDGECPTAGNPRTSPQIA